MGLNYRRTQFQRLCRLHTLLTYLNRASWPLFSVAGILQRCPSFESLTNLQGHSEQAMSKQLPKWQHTTEKRKYIINNCNELANVKINQIMVTYPYFESHVFVIWLKQVLGDVRYRKLTLLTGKKFLQTLAILFHK